jgi:enoyl-CoA hydratase
MGLILYEKTDKYGILTFNNPEKLNAIDFAMLDELNAVLDGVENDRDLRCLILTGSGEKAFIAGGDIAVQNAFGVLEAYDWSRLGVKTLGRIEKLPMPVIGAVNGYALGGGFEVALCCDMLFFSENAVVGFPETGLGIIPGFGGTQRIARKVPLNTAKELVFTGARIGANEAYRIGVANAVVPLPELMGAAVECAKRVCKNGPIAVRKAKIAINEGVQTDLERGLLIESAVFAGCFETKDKTIAMTAFLEKKKDFVFVNA